MRNKPLSINFHIIDVATDETEKTVTYELRKVDINVSRYRSLREAAEAEERQKKMLDAKKQAIINMIIWAANNGKILELINVQDDKE